MGDWAAARRSRLHRLTRSRPSLVNDRLAVPSGAVWHHEPRLPERPTLHRVSQQQAATCCGPSKVEFEVFIERGALAYGFLAGLTVWQTHPQQTRPPSDYEAEHES